MSETKVQVLVVGAGLAGLSTTMFLANRGIRVLMVEKRAATSIHPKAAGQNPRTMELLRIGGIADEVQRASDIKGERGDFTIKVAESVGGKVLHTFAESFEELVAATADGTPQPWALVAQDRVEPIMLAQAEAHGAITRYATELVSFEEHADGVAAVTRTKATGEQHTVTADYLVAADGPHSAIREQLGISRYGHGTLSQFVGIIFEADLSSVLPPGSTGWYYLQNPEFTGNFGPTDRPNRHTFFVAYSPERGETPEDFTPERCVELIRIGVNIPDLDPALLDIQQWEMAARVAEQWRHGRVFLAGDAAKVTPPTGGLGGNTAVGDGYDLAWKLASVLTGEAGPGLLDSYEPERKQVADLVVAESMHVYASRMAPNLLEEFPEPVGYGEVILGFRCRSEAVVITDNDLSPVEDPLCPSGRPGFRAPHVWVRRGGERVSTVDLFGEGWVLISASADAQWAEAAKQVAAELGVSLDTFTLGTELTDPGGTLVTSYGIGNSGACLVRPDGIVAWRAETGPGDPHTTLLTVLKHVLSR